MSTQSSTQATQGGEGLGPTTYTIAGIKVEFPTKAYPSQIAMMNQVIQGLKQRKNCLLESPTGSGKTLALLCAALAWQRHEAVRAAEFNAEIDARNAALDTTPQDAGASVIRKSIQGQELNKEASCGDTSASNDCKDQSSSFYFKSVNGNGTQVGTGFDSPSKPLGFSRPETILLTDDEDDDFKPTKRTKNLSLNDSLPPAYQEVPINVSSAAKNPVVDDPDKPYFVPPDKKIIVPKIFFGTRTHKQISQITRELRKTFYKTVRSVILASREHTCVNPLVEGRPNKNEACRELLDNTGMGGGCMWHQNAKKMSNFGSLQHFGVLPGYDLEDLVAAGREVKSCPYYATRFLMTNADIIFCPYNYIIDPNIRRSMNIDLDNQILIFDEAHNMEDASREAASFTMRQDEIQKAMQDCEKIKNIGGVEPYAHGEMANLFSSVSVWIDCQCDNLREVSFNSSGRFWTGTEAIASLHAAGLTEERIRVSETYLQAIVTQRDRDMEAARERGSRFQQEKPSAAVTTLAIAESVFRLFSEMHKDYGRQRDDFRIALIKSTEKRRRDGNGGPFMSGNVYSLNVWCLNPAVAFSEIREKVHSIVLTSGTLSPMQSFQSELGTPFPLKLEASHVIDKNQVWAGVLGMGPNRVNLNGSYQNAETYSFQDEIGTVIQYVCDTMPYGILCFFPSYRMLDKMIERWQITGRHGKMHAKKHIVVEPRTGAADFEKAMNEFYGAISNCDAEGTMGGMTGAIFFAVCRGKVSEGLDFSDNNARAVICIGIPFPNYRDMQVELKRDYNQKNIHRGLLPGGDWYEIQAFRALNQALGRCIRHRQDWGAILLIDDRYLKNPRYIGSLSKWIRSSVKNFESWSSFPASFESFKDEMLARPVHTETSFGTQQNASICDSVDLGMDHPGGGEGGDIFNGAAQFGTHMDNGDVQRSSNPLVSFSTGFSSGCNNSSMDYSSIDGRSNVDVNFSSLPKPNNNRRDSGSFNGATGVGVSSNNRSGRPSVANSGIAAMFARQHQKKETKFVSPRQVSLEFRDSGISEPEPPTRHKRARERKIKL